MMMPYFEFEATYIFTTADSIWADSPEDAREKIESNTYVVHNELHYPWDDIQIQSLFLEDE
jgi:hypothetical protein